MNMPEGRLTPKPLQEAYVNYLKEDKLRALGVDEQVPKNSPALSVMSRQGSSQSSAVLASPTLTSSHVGPFPTSFYGAANPASYIGKPVVSHFPRYSMAHTSNEMTLVSPNQFPPSTEPHIAGTWSPPTYFVSQQGSRVASPGVNGHVHTFGPTVPPTSPIGISNVGQVSNRASSDLLARMREQQALLQIQQLEQQQHHHQQILQQRSSPSLGIYQDGERVLQPVAHYNQAEIAIPIPRGHRQNPSENLQKGVDEAEAHMPFPMGDYEGREGSKAVQTDGSDGYSAKITSNNVGRLATQNARANGSVLDASLSARGNPDHETNQSGQPQSRHSCKASQLNVNAPKFEPRILKNSAVFSFLGSQQAQKAIETASLGLPSSDGALQAPNGVSRPNKWNVAAPAFMPTASVMATTPSREFSFSALHPSFRPDAPVFKPGDSANASGPEAGSERNAAQPAQKIFGDVNFSEVIKPRKSKAITITKPNKESESKEKFDGDMDGQEDESGRITQADGRQKRMRYVDSEISLQNQDFALRRKTYFGGANGAFTLAVLPKASSTQTLLHFLPLLKYVSRLDFVFPKGFPLLHSVALPLEQSALNLEWGMLTPKSSRRERDNGDQIPLFASSEENFHWMDRRIEDRADYLSRTPSPESEAVDATTLDATTDLLEELIDDLSATEASDLMREEESVDEDGKKGDEYVFNDLGEAASFNTARPPDPHEVCEIGKPTPYARPLFEL